MDGLYQIAEKSNGFTIHIDNARDPIIDDDGSCPGSNYDRKTVGIRMSIKCGMGMDRYWNLGHLEPINPSIRNMYSTMDLPFRVSVKIV